MELGKLILMNNGHNYNCFIGIDLLNENFFLSFIKFYSKTSEYVFMKGLYQLLGLNLILLCKTFKPKLWRSPLMNAGLMEMKVGIIRYSALTNHSLADDHRNTLYTSH